ncbi:MAG: hypothetical protein MAG715_00241 [Methanonatronarchaeales archaeon]|nr:hypothetical protein [Methanonatronarchaeales archaeon]
MRNGEYDPENGATFLIAALAGLLVLGGIYAWRRGGV